MKRTALQISLLGGLLAMVISLGACKKDYLDNTKKDALSDATQWASESNADIYLNDVYNNLPSLSNQPENLDNFTDDNDAGFYYGSYNHKQGILDPSSTNYGIWGSNSGTADIDRHNWSGYNQIRKVNTFIQKITENKANFSADWYNKRLDEARFLRAFYYSNMFLNMGGLAIITAPQSRDDDDATLYKSRSTYAETLKFITSSMDTVVNNAYLPIKYAKGANAGRATLGAAQMVKAYLELVAASPAYNAATAAGGDDPNKVASFGNVDPARWATAAASFKKFIDMWGDGKNYQLFPEDSTLWYEANEYNSEVIWDRQYNPGGTLSSTFETYGGPVWVLGAYYTWGNYCPTQELVDQFFMANGKAIDEPGSGYDPQNPYVNRERRFYKWIVYDGAPYKMDWMPTADVIYTRYDQVNPSKNQLDKGQDDVGNTGYYFKKKLNPLVRPGSGLSGANYIYYRYTEVLLGYAEAQNEAVGPDQSVYDAINKVRKRSSLPDLTPGLSQAEMRKAIRQERRVELCFEGKRYYDIIRWKIAETVMNVDRHAMEIRNTKPADNSGVWTYTVIPLNHPHTFTKRMYINPIPIPVIAQNKNLVQNPGY